MKKNNTGKTIGIILAVLLGLVVIGGIVLHGFMAFRFGMAYPGRMGIRGGFAPYMGRGFFHFPFLGLLLFGGLIYLIVRLIRGPRLHPHYGHHGMGMHCGMGPYRSEPSREEMLRFHEERMKFHEERFNELRSASSAEAPKEPEPKDSSGS